MERAGNGIFTSLEVKTGILLELLSFVRLDAEEKELDVGSFLFSGLSLRVPVVLWDIVKRRTLTVG